MSFRINTINIPFEVISPGGGPLLVVDVPIKVFEYTKDGQKTDKHVANAYDCILPRNGYQKIRLKVAGPHAPITPQMLTAAGGAIEAIPEDFVAKIYLDNRGQMAISAKATNIAPTKKA